MVASEVACHWKLQELELRGLRRSAKAGCRINRIGACHEAAASPIFASSLLLCFIIFKGGLCVPKVKRALDHAVFI